MLHIAKIIQAILCCVEAIKKPLLNSGFFEFGVPTGIRTPVTAVKGRCPRPLDDRDLWGNTGKTIFGGVKRDRTADLYNAIVALYQLSYDPSLCERNIRDILPTRQQLI